MRKQTITASALIFKNHKLLIVKRSDTKSFLPGLWELPGSHVEFGESIADALIREIKEEIHIEISIGKPIHVFTYITNKNSEHVVEIDCLAKMSNEDQEIKLNKNDHSAYKWISKKGIDDYFGSNDNERDAVQKGFESLSDNEL